MLCLGYKAVGIGREQWAWYCQGLAIVERTNFAESRGGRCLGSAEVQSVRADLRGHARRVPIGNHLSDTSYRTSGDESR